MSGEGLALTPSNRTNTDLSDTSNNHEGIFPAKIPLITPFKIAKSSAATNAAGDVTLNFVNADIKDVAKSVLGDLFSFNYVIDPAVQGTITMQTNQPLEKNSVLPAFQTALRISGFALTNENGIYKILPLANAGRQGLRTSGVGSGYGTEIIQLKYVTPAEIRRVIEPLVPLGTIVEVDQARNILIVAGNELELEMVRENVETFDVDWLSGMSFALYTAHVVDARQLVEDLKTIVDGPDNPMAGLVRLVPIQRMNAVLAISSQPKYLEQIKTWVERLDHGNETTERRLYVYYVQNGRAADLGAVLGKAFGIATSSVASSGNQSASGNAGAGGGFSSGMGTGAGGFSVAANTQNQSGPPNPAGSPESVTGGADSSGTTGSNNKMRITADGTTNSLLILATSSEYELVQAALRKLDIVPLQVMIEAMIVEVTLTKELRFGVQWFFRSGQSQFTSADNSAGTVGPELPGFSYFFTNSSNVNVALNALENLTTVKVLSSPELMVLNNQTASLQVGDQVPVATQSAISTSSPGAPIVNSISFVDTGVILKVTPRVNEGGLVLMDISQEVSDVDATTTSSIDSPTIAQRRISSTIAIQDGQTVALGGLIRDSDTRSKGGIPFLQGIPVLGYLFKTDDNMKSRTELIVLLTPRVVRNEGDALAVTNELRGKLSGLAAILKKTSAKGAVPP